MVMLVSEIKDYEKYLDDNNWVAEVKRDGIRIQIHYIRDNQLLFFNRNGEPLTKDIPAELINELEEKLISDNYATSFIIDGELTFTDNKGLDHRTQAQCSDAEPIIWLWDIVELSGEDLRERPWAERKAELKTLCSIYNFTYTADSNIRYLPHFIQKRELLKMAEEGGMEGIILKKVDANYEEGKSKNQIKIKFTQTDDFIVIGYTKAEGTKTGKREKYFGALILAQYKNGKLKPKGRLGGGYNDSDLEQVTKLLQKDKYEENSMNAIFENKLYGIPKGKINWLRPTQYFVVEVKYNGLTEYGIPFLPRFVKIRNDKKIRECIENE